MSSQNDGRFFGFGAPTLKIEGGVCNPYDLAYANGEIGRAHV